MASCAVGTFARRAITAARALTRRTPTLPRFHPPPAASPFSRSRSSISGGENNELYDWDSNDMKKFNGLYEGLKAYSGDDSEIGIFGVELNAVRMQEGAERLWMPSPSVQQFVDAVKQTVLANKRWVYKICGEVKAKGFSDVLFLDADTGKFVEEGSRNIFVVKVSNTHVENFRAFCEN